MTVSVEEVQLRSYMIWEREGRPMGRDQEHWFRAQAELAEDAGAMHGCAECLLRRAGAKARSPLRESWKWEHNYLFLKRLEKWVCPLCGHEKVERCLKHS